MISIESIEKDDDYTVITYWAYQNKYKQYYPNVGFTPDQIKLLDILRTEYITGEYDSESQKDYFEDNVWYVINQSELFEEFWWSPEDTRSCIMA